MSSAADPASARPAGFPEELDVRPLAGALGAEIDGIDLSGDLADETVAAIRAALVRNGVIVFRDQALDVTAHKRLARRFGDIFIHPFLISDDPEVVTVARSPGDRRIVGEDWHADTTMMPEPPMGAIMVAVDVPAYGGDTLFACQATAFEALSDGMKRMLGELRALHSDRMVAGPGAADRSDARTTKSRVGPEWRETVTAHPVVRTHPESGRRGLFVNHSYTVGFENMTEDESRPLLEWLMNWGHRPEFTCRVRWAPGTVVFWDNRSTKHLAVHDAHHGHRVMRRVQIAGDRPR